MEHRKIINYIKIRDQWKDVISTKNKALISIWKGLYEFGYFVAYYTAENYFFSKEIDELYTRNPNYKYFFYLALFFGCWGVFSSLLGIYSYFESSDQAKQLEQQVEEIEKSILN
jgi:hypothetical protein